MNTLNLVLVRCLSYRCTMGSDITVFAPLHWRPLLAGSESACPDVYLSCSLLLDNERWRQADVPAEFQDLVDSIADGRISLPERKIPGIVSQSPVEAQILFTRHNLSDTVSPPPRLQVQMRRNLLSSCWSMGRNTP